MTKIHEAIYQTLLEKTESSLLHNCTPKYIRQSDELQGYDIEDYSLQDIEEQWEIVRAELIEDVKDYLPINIAYTLAEMIMDITY